MTNHVQDHLLHARNHLSHALEHLAAVEGFDELERHAALELRADVSAAIRRLTALLIFAERAER